MKYFVHLTSPVLTKLSDGNFRGEARWERNVVDALLSQGRDVHTTNAVWYSKEPKPANLFNGCNLDWLDDSVLITYGKDKGIFTGYLPVNAEAKYRIVQYQDGPSEQTKDTFFQFDKANPGSIVATCSFKAWEWMHRLQSVLGFDNVKWVTGPTIPHVVDVDNFKKPNLLWSYRNFCQYAHTDVPGMTKLFNQVGSWMSSDPSLKLVILCFPYPFNEAEDLAGLAGNRTEWFLKFPFTATLQGMADRITILSDIHWSEMLDVVSESRMIISPAEPLGGPPYEAAMYGIPIVLEHKTNPFTDRSLRLSFPHVLTAPKGINDEFMNHLNRLYSDHRFYRTHGDAYRNFVKDNATYEAYVKQIDDICRSRGWMK